MRKGGREKKAQQKGKTKLFRLSESVFPEFIYKVVYQIVFKMDAKSFYRFIDPISKYVAK